MFLIIKDYYLFLNHSTNVKRGYFVIEDSNSDKQFEYSGLAHDIR